MEKALEGHFSAFSVLRQGTIVGASVTRPLSLSVTISLSPCSSDSPWPVGGLIAH
jgi:hypothetical protein